MCVSVAPVLEGGEQHVSRPCRVSGVGHTGGKAPPMPAPGAAAASIAAANGANGASGTAPGAAVDLMVAGSGIQRNIDPRLVVYAEINGVGDDKSVCSTPPPLSMHHLLIKPDAGAFGPLTPHPLSPSLLTLCGQPGVDDQFEFAPPPPGPIWDPTKTAHLLDMRTCQSPRLPSS